MLVRRNQLTKWLFEMYVPVSNTVCQHKRGVTYTITIAQCSLEFGTKHSNQVVAYTKQETFHFLPI